MAGIAEQLRQAVLQAAIQGKLTEQLPEDGNARDLLAEIQSEKAILIAKKKIKKEKSLMPIAEDSVPFEIPRSWKWTYLQNIVNIRSASRVHQSDWRKSGVPFYRAREIVKLSKNGFVDNELFVDEELYNKYASEDDVPVEGDLMVSGVGTLGASYIVKDTDKFYYKDASVLCFENRFGVYPAYLRLLMETPLMMSQIYASEAYGTTVATLTMDRAYAFVLPLPPLAEQHRIVARVEELMAKIDELEKVENELNALHKAFPGDMKAALLQAAMQGKLTEQLREDGNVDELLLAIEKERNELIAKKEIKKDDLENLTDIPFDVPESWRWVKLNNIVIKNIKRGKSPTYAPNSHILVFAQKCNTKAGYINMDLALFLDEDKAKKYPNSEYMQDADTVINSTGNGTLGRVGFYRESDNPRHFPVVPDSHVTVVRTSSKLNKKYVMYCLKYFQPYFEKKCTGSTNQTELGVDIVKNLPFPVPPIKEQQRIVEKLDKLLPLCDSLEEKL